MTMVPRLTWVLRSFLDYRIPVFAHLDQLVNSQLHVVFPQGQTPERCRKMLRDVLGDRAVEMTGELSVGTNKPSRQFANASWVVPYQPGLLRTIRDTRPDVVIGDGFFQWSVPALWYRVTRGIPLVLCYERTFHTERKAQWYRRGYRKLAARYVDAVCCNGQLSRDYTESMGIPRDRITTGFMAADSANLQRAVERVSSDEIERIRRQHRVEGLCYLFVGQLVPRKGIRELLEAWTQFEKQHASQATLLLIGDGDEGRELQRITRERGLDHVRFVGPIDYDAIAPFYRLADVVVMPTLEDNWSLVVPEAMACGLPVLCSKYNGGSPDLIHDGENGWVFDPLSTEDTTAALTMALDAGPRLRDMGCASYQIAGRFTPADAARAVLDACELARSHRARRGAS
ncbi:MAG: glycosyltransferase family 4 protein [Planctomycetales bacterium]|nr:glycosyltransferase family 4 protein [Planctomycetales bacterium]